MPKSTFSSENKIISFKSIFLKDTKNRVTIIICFKILERLWVGIRRHYQFLDTFMPPNIRILRMRIYCTKIIRLKHSSRKNMKLIWLPCIWIFARHLPKCTKRTRPFILHNKHLNSISQTLKFTTKGLKPICNTSIDKHQTLKSAFITWIRHMSYLKISQL
jgi:hypothetical protein